MRCVRSFVVTAALGAAISVAQTSNGVGPDGRARNDTRLVPAVEAAFQMESYRPRRRARLIARERARTLTIQILEAGPELDATASDTIVNGVPVTPVKTISRRPGRQRSTRLPRVVGSHPAGRHDAPVSPAQEGDPRCL